jgi:tetratricopeptide (TPR) repeat protein
MLLSCERSGISAHTPRWLFSLGLAAFFLLALHPVPALAEDSEQTVYEQIEQNIQSGQIDTAIDEARQALTKYPDSPRLNQALGTACYQRGLKSEAAEAFRKAVVLDPSVAMNYFNLGLIELGMRDPRATKDLETFVTLAPDNAVGHLLLGHAYHYTNRTLLAIEQYKRALELSPDIRLGHYHLGVAYESQGDLSGALEEFKKEIALDPDYNESYWLAGNIEIDRGNLNDAEKLFRSSISRNPETFQAHYGLARVLVASDHMPEAETELKKCLELNADSIEAHYLLARTYQRMGRQADAEREYQIISTLHSQRHAHVNSGIAGRQP